MEPTVTKMIVTPAKAEEWLKSNTDNRDLRGGNVAMLVNAIKSNQWRLTHQPVAFDTTGKLLDGQHRLQAVVETGASLPMMVCFGADPASYDAIDIGAKRNLAELFHVSRKIADVAHRLARLRLNRSQQTPATVKKYIDRFGETISDLNEFASGKTRKTLSSSSVRAMAVLRSMIDGREYAFTQYRELVHLNFANMAPVVQAFVKAEMRGKVHATSVYDTACRAWDIFNIQKKDNVRVVVHEQSSNIGEIRDAIDLVMGRE